MESLQIASNCSLKKRVTRKFGKQRSGNNVTYYLITIPFILKIMKNPMNAKTKYMIPAFAAVFALMFVIATPYVMAQEGDDAKWDGKKSHKGHHAILIEGFSGAIPVPQEMTKETHDSLRSQVTVSLSQAAAVAEANGLEDAMMAKIGIVKNAEGAKYVAWIVSSMDKDVESNTMTTNIIVVDAGNSNNFATTTKTFDHSMKERMHGDKAKKFDKLHQKFSEPTGNPDIDAKRAEFLDLMQQLKDAYANGDTETANAIKSQLQELKRVFLDMRNQKF
jgi:hypothetical protein